MKRHLTASRMEIGARSEPSARRPVGRTHAANFSRAQTISGERHLSVARANPWMHTVILTGDLSQRTAHALEAEIDRLCEEGVDGITLDLRQLASIDATGVAVVAFRAGLCERRGYEFALVRGPRPVHRAFEQAGVVDGLPFRDERDHAGREAARATGS
jgi:anti-anti-sigma factor